MWKVLIKSHDKTKSEDYTERIGEIEWSDSTDQLGAEFSFTTLFSKWDENYNKTIAPGPLFLLYNDSTLWFQGVITETPINGGAYKGYDLSWYLNQSTTIIQFKKIRADKAIKQLCSKFGVPIGSISSMKTSIKKVYKDETPADIINDILDKVKDETGTKHRIEMQNGKLYITKLKRIEIKPTYVDELGETVPCVNAAEITGQMSIEKLRNYVQYATKKEKQKGVKATAKSSESIKKYGLLSTVYTKDKLTPAKARQYAKNKLKSLNKVEVTFSCRMPGSASIRPGRWIEFPEMGIGISGWYKVKSCTHKITGDKYFVELEMSNG